MPRDHAQFPEPEGHGFDYTFQRLQQVNASNYYGYGSVGGYGSPDATHFGGPQTLLAQPDHAPRSAYFASPQVNKSYVGDNLPVNWAHHADNAPIGQTTYAADNIVTSGSNIPHVTRAMSPTACNSAPTHAPPQFGYMPYSETLPVAATHHHYHHPYIATPPKSAPAPESPPSSQIPAGDGASNTSTPFTDLSLNPSANVSAATTPEPFAHLEEPAVLFADEFPKHPGWYSTPDGPDVVAQECLLGGGCCGFSGLLPKGKGEWARHVREEHPIIAKTRRCPAEKKLKDLPTLGRHIGSIHLGQEKMLCLLCRDRARIAALQRYGSPIQANEAISPDEKVEADMKILSEVEVRYTIKRNEKDTRTRHAKECMKKPMFKF
ncbi:hypothetical protein EWM64_g5828 [Hericium alpestre]|uniref:Uncharacterized protein n=1 Tax=Hericium alpestre TaxID=135208 RepID=A0A4Y9ZVC3_9AGAM|nr:hypothetical protein EWM64_g5828 [Hericium alpestre]